MFEYFKRISNIERMSVKFLVSDMSNFFKSVRDRFFRSSIHIIDRYYFIRQVSWALENVRKRIQRDVSSKLRVFLREARV
ncbi:Transposase [Peptoniphilus indolicus]|uniref:Transposase n=1 Tax=Peptoniphilus indolicus TaxID=33030 RepID=A0A379DDJ9_9FIRM|nr:Transposase [Peptoniphilus indolicus]